MSDIVKIGLHALAQRGIDGLEEAALSHPQVNCDVIHRFGPGVYIREVSVPAGTFAIGHKQKHDHMNVMLKGRVTILNEDGTSREITAPEIFVGKPGRKVGYVHEDMVWMNIYSCAETDAAVAEAMFIDKSETWQSDCQSRLLLAGASRDVDRADYMSMLAETGFDEETARAQSEDTADQIAFPLGNWKVIVSDSPINGRGLFASAHISPGEVIAPARINGKRTPAGRYTNHAKEPNAVMEEDRKGDIALVATSHIGGCGGGQNGEEITIDYREAIKLARRLEAA